MHDRHPLRGVYPVLQTPFHEREEVDLGALADEVGWVLDQGADGVTIGMVSEVLRLSSDERDRVALATCASAKRDGGSPSGGVVVSVVAESTHTAIRHARHAEAAGADAIMAAPPALATGATAEELLRFYTAVIESVGIPTIVQDASGYVGTPIPLELQARLCREYGDRVMFKPEAMPVGARLSALRTATGGRARVFEGLGGTALVDSHRRGVVGTMPAADLTWAVVAMWQALEEGDYDRAYRISLPLTALVSLQSSLDGFVAVEKRILVRLGVIPRETVRGPVDFMLDPETAEEVDRLLALLQGAVARASAASPEVGG